MPNSDQAQGGARVYLRDDPTEQGTVVRSTFVGILVRWDSDGACVEERPNELELASP